MIEKLIEAPPDLNDDQGWPEFMCYPPSVQRTQAYCKMTHYLDANIFLTQTWPPSYELVSSQETSSWQKDLAKIIYHLEEVSLFIGHVESGEANPKT